ncbi:hypothetical protein [Streptomyces sp. NPDC002845]
MKSPVSVLDDGRYRTALDRHGVDQREMFSRLTAEGVVWADGTKEAIDAVVPATGYRLASPYLTGSSALDADGQPQHRGGIATEVPEPGFVDMELQQTPAPPFGWADRPRRMTVMAASGVRGRDGEGAVADAEHRQLVGQQRQEAGRGSGVELVGVVAFGLGPEAVGVAGDAGDH